MAAGSEAEADHDDRVLHRAVLFELAHHVRDRALLLADGDVDALNAGALLVDDRVDRDRGLAGLAVADDQLALAAADRHHRVDRLEAGLHRLAHRSCGRSRPAPRARSATGGCLDRTLAVDRVAERVHHAAEQLRADRHFEDAAGGLARSRLRRCACSRRAPRRRPSPAPGSARGRRCRPETRSFRRTSTSARPWMRQMPSVTRHDGADVARLGRGVEVLDARLDQVADFGCLDGHVFFPRLIRQLRAEPREAALQRTVDHQVAGADDGAADQRLRRCESACGPRGRAGCLSASASRCRCASRSRAAAITSTSTTFSISARSTSNIAAICGQQRQAAVGGERRAGSCWPCSPAAPPATPVSSSTQLAGP